MRFMAPLQKHLKITNGNTMHLLIQYKKEKVGSCSRGWGFFPFCCCCCFFNLYL